MNISCTNSGEAAAAVVGAMLGMNVAAALGVGGPEKVDGMRRMASREFRRRSVPAFISYSWSSIPPMGSRFRDRYGREYVKLAPHGQIVRLETLLRRIRQIDNFSRSASPSVKSALTDQGLAATAEEGTAPKLVAGKCADPTQ